MSTPELAYTYLPPTSPPQAVANPSTSPHSEETIIFLHGGESCSLEFSRIAPLLSTYEIYLIDLPGHSRSASIPFTFSTTITLLSELITTKIKEGKAHIVGLSLGGFIALQLAKSHPELVRSVWCTGCAPFTGFSRFLRSRTWLLSGMIVLAKTFATEKIFWKSFGADIEPIPGLREEVQRNQNMKTLQVIFEGLKEIKMQDLEGIKGVRICVVAGGKGDDVEATRELGELLRRENRCEAFVVRDAIHWWSLQLPVVFAEGVRAWIEGREMGEVYVSLLGAGE